MIRFSLLISEGVWQLVTIPGLSVFFRVPCYYALKPEVSVGAYRSKKCGHEIVPTFKEVLMAMHKDLTRHLMCPKCNQRTWCEKVIKR